MLLRDEERLRKENKILTLVAVGLILLLLIVVSLMIGFKLKKDDAVYKREIVVTTNLGQESEEVLLIEPNLNIPLSVIENIKSLRAITDKNETIEFTVVSFYYIEGQKLVLYGMEQMIQVREDGKAELMPSLVEKGTERLDSDKREVVNIMFATSTSFPTSGSTFAGIYDCTGLRQMTLTGNYTMMDNLECNFTEPLFKGSRDGFSGVLNGNGFNLTIHIESDGEASLFYNINRGTIINLILKGDVKGQGRCSGIAIVALPGTKFISCGVYVDITCTEDEGEISVGAFASILRNPNKDNSSISFIYSISESIYHVEHGRYSSKQSFEGGFYGRSEVDSVRTFFNSSYSATNFSKPSSSDRVDPFGFKYSSTQSNGSTLYIPEDCYNFDETNINYINMCVEFFLQNMYENPSCCSYFDSCFYTQCSMDSKICMQCRKYKQFS